MKYAHKQGPNSQRVYMNKIHPLSRLYSKYYSYSLPPGKQIPTLFFKPDMERTKHGPVGSNHGNLQNTPLLALGYRALRELPRCTVRG